MPILLLLSFGSGCAALIFELVWFQLLQFVIGASSLSLAALLASFMGGMALGSAALPWLVSARRHPLRVYAALELAIAVSGLALPVVLPYVRLGYISAVGYGYAAVVVRMAVCSACLLLPTIMMGATLPAIGRWTGFQDERVSWLGLFYAANTAGGVCGALLASFFLLRVFDMQVATFVAVALNVTVAVVALRLATVTPHVPPVLQHDAGATPGARSSDAPVWVATGLSGLVALGAEVIWTRQLSLLLGATVYTFSLILAVFLAGIGLGGMAGAAWARRTRSPRLALGWCQTALVLAIALGARAIVSGLPLVQPTAHRLKWIYASLPLGFAWDAIRCALALLPATILWGASFSLALTALSRTRDGDTGRQASAVTTANTAGSLLGSLVFTLLVVPRLGTERAQQLLVAGAALAACLMFWFSPRPRARLAPLCLLAAIPVAIWLVPPVPLQLITFGHNVDSWAIIKRVLYVAEGVTSSVAVTEDVGGQRQFHIAGKVEASNIDIDMRLERMLGHVPALLHPHPRSVLVVGFGAGITAGSFLAHPEIERVVICEIEPAVPLAAGRYFAKENHQLLDDPRTTIVYDDARHFMETSNETFDIITSDPIHPWVRGAATLYSAEYLDLVKRHLNPGGVVTQWVPLYETDTASVKSEIATFAQAFPETTLWSSDIFEDEYDLVVLGRTRPESIDVDAMQARLDRQPAVLQSLNAVTLKSAAWLMGTYLGRASDFAPWLRGAQINYERNLRLQYLAGLALTVNETQEIFGALWGYRRYPADLFVASPGVEAEMRRGYSRADAPSGR